ASPRAGKVFLPVNCGALAESILESELFGHEKGAFTGAERRRRGCFEIADKGTLFLDEVGNASTRLQAILLRVLELGEFQRVGGERLVRVDVRVVAATNIDLEKAVENKTFREDFYYRLGAVKLELPPLRLRQEDILPLAEHFLRQVHFSRPGDRPALSPEAVQALLRFHWPGNARELANVIHGAAAIAEGGVIQPEDLPERILQDKGNHFGLEGLPFAGGTRPPVLKELEKSAIIATLQYCRGNIKAAASVLGIGRATMHRKIKEYGIDVSRKVTDQTRG
ncbi:MAG: sigma-54 dependent transcriptional regulator, partial [Firmicutes bacterium]|nr:sigma-54 dependent transcriptional regulator [Bacillota bacterium]